MRKREATSPPRSGYPFSRLSRHEGGAHMPDDRCRLGSDDVIIGLDLASAEHQAVVLTVAGQRLTRFRIPHTRAGLEDLLRRTTPAALGRAEGARIFAFEATGHMWEAVAYVLRGRGERYVVVNPLATFRVREAQTIACPDGLDVLAREVQRAVARMDMLTAHMTAVVAEIDVLLVDLEEVPYLRTIPGLGGASVAGLLAHVGAITKYHHGRQLIKLAGTNPSRRDSGQMVGRGRRMSHRGRAGLREVLYRATLSCLQHNPRIRAHYDRLIQRADRPLPKMQALGACMNKLLLYAFAVMRRREAFQLDHDWPRTMARVA